MKQTLETTEIIPCAHARARRSCSPRLTLPVCVRRLKADLDVKRAELENALEKARTGPKRSETAERLDILERARIVCGTLSACGQDDLKTLIFDKVPPRTGRALVCRFVTARAGAGR
jgi:hypothetical protein